MPSVKTLRRPRFQYLSPRPPPGTLAAACWNAGMGGARREWWDPEEPKVGPSPPKVGTKAGAWILNLNIFPFLFSNIHEFSFNCQKKSGLEPTKTSETIDSSRNSPLLHDGQ